MSRHQGSRRDAGQGLVEYAVVLPLLLLLVFGLMELARVLSAYGNIANAAREGARAGIVPYPDPGQRVAACVSAAIQWAQPLTLTYPENVNCTWEPVAMTVRAQISYEVHLMTETFIQAVGGQLLIPLHSSATMRSE